MTGDATRFGRTAIVALLSLSVWHGQPFDSAAGSPVPAEAQSAYGKQQYQRVLDELAKLDKDRSAAPDVRRLKVRSLLRLGKPKEALDEYDLLEQSLKRDDEPLLREVAFGFIVVLLKDMREQMRGAAYTALKEVNSPEAIPYLEDGLSDGSGPVRVLAVEGLGRLPAGRSSKKLRSALEDQAGLVKARVVKVLGQTGDQALIPLIETAEKDDLMTVRIAAYSALLQLGRKEAWEQLRQAAESPNPEDRAEALRTMAVLKDQRGAALMAELLTYTQPSVRGAAARGLGHLGRAEARGNIERLLKDPVPAVRESAASSLADLGGTESVPALSQALNDGGFTVRAATAAALLQLGQPYEMVAPTVRGLVQHNDPAARSSAAYALGKAVPSNRAGAIATLINLMADPLPGPKTVAVRSLGHIGDREIIPALKEALHDTNEAVRATAGGALAHLLAEKNQLRK